MLAITLPDWLDADTLRNAALVAIVVLALGAYAVVRLVRTLVLRVALVAVLAALGLVVWSQRADLGRCIEERDCGCTIAGFEVPLPESADRFCGEG